MYCKVDYFLAIPYNDLKENSYGSRCHSFYTIGYILMLVRTSSNNTLIQHLLVAAVSPNVYTPERLRRKDILISLDILFILMFFPYHVENQNRYMKILPLSAH